MQTLKGNIANSRYSANVMRAQLDQLKARSQTAVTAIQTINGQSIVGEGDLTLQELFGTDLYKKFDTAVNNPTVGQLGVYFTPHIEQPKKILSWTNNAGLENPPAVDLNPLDQWVDEQDAADSQYTWEDED